ncbi:MAG: hypothetical protein H6812_10100 [Phycisphaeraceae bacterium]|nr:hypothetical protein [Phycisphaerales bacterium]MCB9843597.1 hypothetical protein [Phycisphaeraceae bacterium]
MIRSIAQLVSGGVDLLEAEGRLARLHLVRIAALLAILISCSITAAGAIGAIGAGLVIVLTERMGLGGALIAVGLGLVLLTLISAMWAWSGLGRE